MLFLTPDNDFAGQEQARVTLFLKRWRTVRRYLQRLELFRRGACGLFERQEACWQDFEGMETLKGWVLGKEELTSPTLGAEAQGYYLHRTPLISQLIRLA
ncbi:hypothetical protein KSP40_PGU015690 [Platanthera guangdongensis]|uniref:Uncharacterized protein n=1 Tax=Platanthera guangdongensis TaxID=2320717 RepID=A0ABR2LXE5_9ASPA